MDTSKNNANTQSAQDSARESIDQAATGAHKAVDRAAEALSPAVERVSAKAHAAVDQLCALGSQAKTRLSEGKAQLMDKERELAEKTRSHIRQKPLASLAVGAAVAFVIAKMLKPSRPSYHSASRKPSRYSSDT